VAKSVLVTGSSSGIGLSTAQKFASEGWKVFATMRTPDKAVELKAEAAEKGWDLDLVALDVRDTDSIDACYEEVYSKVDALDAVVNNAGHGMLSPVEDASDEEIQAVFSTNVFGMVRVTRKALPQMRARRSGAIVNLSSMGGHVVFPHFAYYHATKWALEALTEGLYLELQPLGVRVYAVMPGLVASGFGRGGIRAEKVSAKETAYQEDIDAVIEGFMNLLPNRVGPETASDKIFEVVESGSTHLHHYSDAFAEEMVTSRKSRMDAEWFDFFIHEMLGMPDRKRS
jgi:NAD(P)-dependent dehydrogenase (short-subunit alcohol dehydrogenase family)